MKILSLFLILLAPLGAQTVYSYNATNPTTHWQILPQAVPTVAADVVKSDVYIDRLELRNTTASALTCTVNDRQGSPIAITPGAISIAANTIYILPFDGTWAPSGVNWVCSGAGVVGYMRGRKAAAATITSTAGD